MAWDQETASSSWSQAAWLVPDSSLHTSIGHDVYVEAAGIPSPEETLDAEAARISESHPQSSTVRSMFMIQACRVQLQQWPSRLQPGAWHRGWYSALMPMLRQP